MRRATTYQFRRWIRELREGCPLIVPVRVRHRPIKESGYANLIFDAKDKPDHFIIILHPDMCEQGTFNSLLHEWAHCVAWTEGHQTMCDHDALWGVALAHCYGEVAEP